MVLLLDGAWWAGAVVGLAAVVTATVGDLSDHVEFRFQETAQEFRGFPMIVGKEQARQRHRTSDCR